MNVSDGPPAQRPQRPLIDIIRDQCEAGGNPLVVFAVDQQGTELDFAELGEEK